MEISPNETTEGEHFVFYCKRGNILYAFLSFRGNFADPNSLYWSANVLRSSALFSDRERTLQSNKII